MGALKNSRHEKFCLELIDGKTRKDAAIAAGYSEHSARMFPYVLLNRADVQARLKELQDLASSEKVMNLTRRKEQLSEIAQARITDFMTTEGSPRFDVFPAGSFLLIYSTQR